MPDRPSPPEPPSPPSPPSTELLRARPLDASALKALAHPLRLRMYDHLGTYGSATATQLAHHLGESTGQTSYHLRQLERHGLIEEDTNRGTGRERWWRSTSFSVSTREMRHDADTAPAAEVLTASFLRDRVQTMQAWMDDELVPDEWVDAALNQRSTMVLSAEELRAMNREVQDVLDRYKDHEGTAAHDIDPDDDDPARRRVRVYYDAFPLPLRPQPA